jgi:site-specific recombinase XerD
MLPSSSLPPLSVTPCDSSDPAQPFEAWAQRQHAAGELSDTSIAKYRPLWMAWVAWCAKESLHWSAAQSTHILEFLQGPAPGIGASRRQAIHPQRMSSYTRQRYWRLLRGIYANATHDQALQLPHNPALDLDERDRPSIARADRTSQILEPFVFEALRNPRTIERLFAEKTDANWWFARDRAIMVLLVEAGLTVSELIQLKGRDILEARSGRPMASSVTQPSLLDSSTDRSAPALWVDVMDNRHTIGRTLPISHAHAPLLRQWLAWRSRLLIERSAQTAALTHREAFMAKHERDGPLLMARRARAGGAIFPEMDATSIYRSVSNAMDRLRVIEKYPAATYIAKGPAVVRNSVIRRWIDTQGSDAAAQWAGLSSAQSLRLHLPQP